MIKGFKIFFTLLLLVIISSCASKRYEWVKINPDKLYLAKTAKPYYETVKRVDIHVSAKPKAALVVYDDTDAIIQNNETPSNLLTETNKPVKEATVYKRVVKEANQKAPALVHKNTTIKGNSQPKNSKLATAKTNQEIALSKLNEALILPKSKSKPKPIVSAEVRAKNDEAKAQARQEAGMSQMLTEEVAAKSPQTTEKNNTSFNENQEQTSSSSEQTTVTNNEEDLVNPQEANDEEANFKRNNYMWVGLVLIIIGLIIGLVFGGLAYLISVVGIVFLLIGYFYKV